MTISLLPTTVAAQEIRPFHPSNASTVSADQVAAGKPLISEALIPRCQAESQQPLLPLAVGQRQLPRPKECPHPNIQPPCHHLQPLAYVHPVSFHQTPVEPSNVRGQKLLRLDTLYPTLKLRPITTMSLRLSNQQTVRVILIPVIPFIIIGKYVALIFYPMDFSFVCPTEIV
jgi:hypothetical protein